VSGRRQDRPDRRPHVHRLAADVALVTPGAPPGYDPTRHNYVRKQLALIAAGKLRFRPGECRDLEIRHDDWCVLLVQGGYCDCDPDIRVR
jgi:hypothetical protein